MNWLRNSHPNLGTLAGTRDNNFNLLRFIAASLVLFTHCFAVSVGKSSAEPLHGSLGTTFGQIAVDVFFLASGFLVTASLLARGSIKEFAKARCLRIYPGLVVAVLLTTVVVGWHFTSLPPWDFFTSGDTWRYLLQNATMVIGVAHTLPGAFEHTPWKHLVNASLWTLPYELAMYGMLGVLWGVIVVSRGVTYFKWAVASLAAMTLGMQLASIGWLQSNALRLTAMFFVGSSLYAFRHVVPMNTRLFLAFAIVLFVATANAQAFAVVYLLTLPYLVIYLAYIPRGLIRRFSHLGDCSYGVYIYAWPVQQISVALVPGIDPIRLFALSFPVTIALACGSWKLIEKPALAMKNRQADLSPYRRHGISG